MNDIITDVIFYPHMYIYIAWEKSIWSRVLDIALCNSNNAIVFTDARTVFGTMEFFIFIILHVTGRN